MAKIFVVSLLLMFVYSWEEFKYFAKFFLRLLLYADAKPVGTNRNQNKSVDRFVSASISLAMLPVGLSFFLESHSLSVPNLIWLILSLVCIAAIARFATALARFIAMLPYGQQMSVAALATYELATLGSPSLRWFIDFDFVERKALAKFAIFLSLPAAVGLTFKFLLGQSYVDERFLPGLDVLIQILIAALFMTVTVSFLENYLHPRQFKKLSHLFRVCLGIVLSAVLLLP